MTKCRSCKSPLEWDAETRRYTPLADQLVVALEACRKEIKDVSEENPGAEWLYDLLHQADLALAKVQEPQDDN